MILSIISICIVRKQPSIPYTPNMAMQFGSDWDRIFHHPQCYRLWADNQPKWTKGRGKPGGHNMFSIIVGSFPAARCNFKERVKTVAFWEDNDGDVHDGSFFFVCVQLQSGIVSEGCTTRMLSIAAFTFQGLSGDAALIGKNPAVGWKNVASFLFENRPDFLNIWTDKTITWLSYENRYVGWDVYGFCGNLCRAILQWWASRIRFATVFQLVQLWMKFGKEW